MSKNTNLSFLTDFITADIVNSRVGINNASPQTTFDVTGTGKFSGILTLGSTISNGTYAYTLPSATGTLALTSDIPSVSGYVPYTGATQAVNLGYNSLSASFLRIDGAGPTLGSYLGFKHSTNVTTGADGYTSIYTFGTNTIAFKSVSGATTRDFSFSMASITPGVPGGRTYTLPDADGTIALTSSLSGYLPLTGGTLTGALIVENNAITQDGTRPIITLQQSGVTKVFLGISSGASDLVTGDASGDAVFRKPASSGAFRFSVDGGTSSAFTILSNGKVGIGTGTPDNSYQGLTISGTDPSLRLKTTSGSGWVWTEYVTSAGVNNFSMGVNQTIPYFGIKAGAGLDNPNFAIVSSGNVLINTTTDAGFKLDVNGTGRFTSTINPIIFRSTNATTMWTEYYYNTSTISGYIGSGTGLIGGANASDFIVRSEADFVVATNGGNRRLTIASTGAATFSSSVTAKGTGNYNGFVADNSSSATIGGGYFAVNSFGVQRGIFGVAGAISGTTDNNVGIFAEGGLGIKFFVNGSGTPSHIMTSGGNVLIGTTTDNGAKFQLGGFSGAVNQNNGIKLTNNVGTIVGLEVGGSNDSYIGTISASNFSIRTANNPIITVTSGGNVGIGTTTINSERLTVSQTTGNASALYVYTLGVATGQSYGLTVAAGTNASDRSFAVFNQAGTSEYFKVRGDGIIFAPPIYNNTTATASNITIFGDGSMYRSTASSERFKENITDWIENGLDTILALKPKEFTYKEDYYNFPERKFLGLIAEEVQEVSNYLVDFENEDGSGQVENVRYANIVVPLIKAIQEQQKQIQELKNKLS